MLAKFVDLCVVLVVACRQSTAQVAPYGEGDCCQIKENRREPCPGGSELRQAACLELGCCHDDNATDGAIPVCYRRKDEPCGRCKVALRHRRPCVGWNYGKEICENLGCCFDKRTFPYCYMTADGTPRNTPSPPPPQRRRSNIGRQQAGDNYWIAAGPDEMFFDPVKREILEVYCPTGYERQRCGHANIQRDECLEVGCCWNPNLGNPVCFDAHRKTERNETMLDAVVQQLETRSQITDDSDSNVDGSPVSQFSYQNFSVALECPLVTQLSVKQKCRSNTRSRCLGESCCWINGECVMPYTHFREEVRPKKPTLPDQALLADYWIPSTIEMYVENTTMQLMCETGKRTLERCGQPGITRAECVNMECCWQPLMVLEEGSDVICSFPVVRDDSNGENNGNYNLAQWGDWLTWSECTASEEGTPLGGKRVRRRDCLAQDRKENEVLSCSGPSSESMDCRDPNGCILGDWSSWTKWTKCSLACSPGVQRRYRRCALEEALDIDPECDDCADAFVPTEYDQAEERRCNEQLCPEWLDWEEGDCDCGERVDSRLCDPSHLDVDLTKHDASCYNVTVTCPGQCFPRWSDWSEFSPCTEICEIGQQMRSRSCLGKDGEKVEGCAGDSNHSIACNTALCLEWSDWTLEGDCDAECEGTGEQKAVRTCLNPPGLVVNEDCSMKYVQCNGSKCFGDWQWTPWSECEDTCGPSAMNRTRFCVYKGQVTDDVTRCMREEPTELLETAPCNEVLCHDWGEWTLEYDCDAPCRGNGSQTRSRPCLDEEKTPHILGETHDESCFKIKVECFGAPRCPPAWTDWGTWSTCSESCSVGARTKTRTCVDDDGLQVEGCSGESEETENCNEDKCAEWDEWRFTGECDAPCEQVGLRKSNRRCLDPLDLTPHSEECWMRDVACNGSRCMGDWTAWSEFSECRDSCRPSNKTRTRTCLFNGIETSDFTRCQRDNEPSQTETVSCNDEMCPLWGDWNHENDCDAPCRGNGSQTVARLCLDAGYLPETHPEFCYITTEECFGAPTCPPEWSEWGNWSECSESCTPGLRSRERVCRSEFGFEDDGCPGEKLQTEDCNVNLCLEWGDWKLSGECVAPCEEPGEHLSIRTCLNPAAFVSENDSCSRRFVPCTGARCLGDWDSWSSWSSCFDACGPSHMNRTRNCIFEGVITEDTTRCHRDEDISSQESIPCNENMCQNWGNWTLLDDCDALCRGTGLQTNERMCLDEIRDEELAENHAESCYRVSVECDGAPVCPPSWSQWSDWSLCSESCARGVETHTRVCLTEDGAEVDGACEGESNQTQSCNVALCQEWGEWTSSHDCDAECEGPGMETHTRECTNPPDFVAINDECNTRRESCEGPRCLGDWDTWSEWNDCYDSCSPSSRNRTRNCVFNSEIHWDLTRCHRDNDTSNVDTSPCNERLCQIWDDWALEDDCDAPCRESGLQTLSRSCLDDGFEDESLSKLHEAACYSVKVTCAGPPTCPPSWSEWENWSPCSESCTNGTTSRSRTCFSEDGLEVDGCAGEQAQSESCNDDRCLMWGEWEFDGDCQAECEDDGLQRSTRTCLDPVGYVDSEDECNTRQVPCKGSRCLGGWDEWTTWSSCFDACGPSVMNRTRNCIFRGGATDDLTRCHREGDTLNTETVACNELLCGAWGEWSLEDDCSAACRDTGIETRSRRCLDEGIDLSLHEADCYTTKVNCSGSPTCPPAWSGWTPWSECSQSCSVGEQSRSRVCLTENGFEADDCDGDAQMTQVCNEGFCQEWDDWVEIGVCDAECEKRGLQQSVRRCLSPSNFVESRDECTMRYDECTGPRCFGDWDAWSQWSTCHDACSPSVRNRTRYCTYKDKMTDDITRCQREDREVNEETESCNGAMCQRWGAWQLQDDCNAPCRANGTQTNARICEDADFSEEFLSTFHDLSCYSVKVNCQGPPVCPPSWSEWGSWTFCSESCTAGLRTRRRLCLSEDGEEVDECDGLSLQTESCNENLCTAWNAWEIAGECVADCEANGTQLLTRLCLSDAAFNEEPNQCNSRYDSCTGSRCMGDWNLWGAWSDCYDKCGPSVRNRTRSCEFRGETTSDLSRCIREGRKTNVDTVACNELLCHDWGEWTLENDCDAPCKGNGSQTKSRRCEDDDVLSGDLSSLHDQSCYTSTVSCTGAPTCPPSWNDWGSWSTCSKTCTIGTRNRQRRCFIEDGVEVNECRGSNIETENCNGHLCLEWQEWQLSGDCDAECEQNGTQVSTRVCVNPLELPVDPNACNTFLTDCVGPRCMGDWGEWGSWSDCHDACGPSVRNRERSCIFKGQKTDDLTRCIREDGATHIGTLSCNQNLCRVWSQWDLQDDCDALCRGTGSETLSRRCLDLRLEGTELSSTHQQSCYVRRVNCTGEPTCPPAWSEWSEWSACSQSCANGVTTRERQCLTEDGDPSDVCIGPSTETSSCNTQLCREWNKWEISGECNAECETNGTQLLTRVCLNPNNFEASELCSSRFVLCAGPRCMGDWNEWSEWSLCYDQCGPSVQNRTRLCVFEGAPTDDLTRCMRNESGASETVACNEDMCRLWSEWISENDCSAPCRGIGLETLTRSCEDLHMTRDMLPNFHNQSCYRRMTECLGAPTCPPAWNEWSSWSICSESCTNGVRSRQRTCFTEFGEEVDECVGSATESENCNENLCLQWSDWEISVNCDANCESNGTELWTRACANPPLPENEPGACNSRQVSCMGQRCMGDWSEWSTWSGCYEKCSPSVNNRTRSCIFQGEVTEDFTRCIKDDGLVNAEEVTCNEFMCPVWSAWTLQEDCDAPCRGNGSQTTLRSCEDENMAAQDLSDIHDLSCYSGKVECLGAPTCPPTWTEWSEWSSCSETCAVGSRSRSKVCLTEFGEETDDCDGLSAESESCNDHLCLDWSDWQLDTTCNAECENNGTEVWLRECANPQQFVDSNLECFTQTVACTGTRCMGNWDQWSVWSECSDPCGPSFTNRTRVCIFEGDVTEDITRCQTENEMASHEALPCNENLCKQWDSWILNDDCNAPCRGIGLQTRSRGCLDEGILSEDYRSLHEDSCYERKVFCLGAPTCPPAWTTWDTWSGCSHSCEVGTRTRQRQCFTETGVLVDECEGTESQTENCNEDLCVEWSDWQTAGECTAECEKDGFQLSARVCVDPQDFVNVRSQCNSRTVPCSGPRCLGDWNAWGLWSECHDSCGPSYRNRSRNCVFEGTSTDDLTRCHKDGVRSDDVEISSCNEILCNDWAEWELQDDCDAPCRGTGLQTRSRQCQDNDVSRLLLPAFHEQNCYRVRVECDGAPTCPPAWSTWGPWSSCSESCSSGVTLRERNCLTEDGDPSDVCDGLSTETSTCNTQLCLEWNDWEISGECNAECETNGTQLLTRVCLNPNNFEASDVCTSRYISCAGPRCMGDWNEWSDWSSCHDNCSPSIQNRTRSCIYRGEMTNDITRCHLEGAKITEDKRSCNDLKCSNWDLWTLEDDCDAPCRGTGSQTRSRRCLDADYTNRDVSFFHDEICFRVAVECSGAPTCPPAWSEWNSWSECSESCTDGVRFRQRQCYTEFGDPTDECEGSSSETGQCNLNICLLWSDWQIVGACNAACEDNGTYPSTRACLDPPGLVGELACSSRQVFCSGPRCKGEWDDWSAWSPCYDNCSPSFSNRSRNCVFQGDVTADLTRCQNDPRETSVETRDCNEFMCRRWGNWSLVDDCNAECRSLGLQTGIRNCLDEGVTREDLSSFHDELCYTSRVTCSGPPICPPAWAEWETWSECSDSCSVGVRSRLRRCLNETGTEVDMCDGPAEESETCNDHLCEEWSSWQVSGDCNADCEETGTQPSNRVCLRPSNFQHEDDDCVFRLELCTGPRCFGDWDVWSTWSGCYDSCGPSLRNRTRYCIYKGEMTDDLTRCQPEGDVSAILETRCNENMCQRWGDWTLEDDCDAPCRGTGLQTNSRVCLDDIESEDFLTNHDESCYTVKVQCQGAPTCPPAWSEWQSWSSCSETCTNGTRTRIRQCFTEDGDLSDVCAGESVSTGQCNLDLCLQWDDWLAVSECDAECEQLGIQRYARNCANPPGLVLDQEQCHTRLGPCVGARCMGSWGEWSAWGDCGEPCKPSRANRTRECVFNGAATADLTRCQEVDELGNWDTIECNEAMCTEWGIWTLLDDCNAPCRGNGNQTSLRECAEMPYTEEVLAELHPEWCFKIAVTCEGAPTCPPLWSEWGSWSDCSATCSRGVKTRYRQCVSEFGEVLDAGCSGTDTNVHLCNEDLCVTWDGWQPTGECDAACEDNGTQRYERPCALPVNFNATDDVCSVKYLPCSGSICLGDWGTWGPWSDCEDICSPSVARRNRDCIVKGEVHSEVSRCYRDNERGSLTQSRVCNQLLCPSWDEWVTNDDCNAPCRGKGVRSRVRNCTVSNSEGSENIVSSLDAHDRSCYYTEVACDGAPTCPPEWSTWGDWSSCSQSCSLGSVYRQRVCVTEFGELTDNDDCIGESREEKQCNTHLCSFWNDWDTARSCDADCEEPGFRWSLRTCRDQAIPVETANECFQYREACVGGPCPGTWGPWGQWSECRDRCGPSVRNRTRSCFLKGDLVDSSRCNEGEASETNSCNEIFCSNWMRWREGNCTGLCGQRGTFRRERACLLNLVSLVQGDDLQTTFPGMPEDCYLKRIDCIVECIPQWTLWTTWSSCTTSCAPGEKVRTRECIYNESRVGPEHCNDPRKVILRDEFSVDGSMHKAPCNLDMCLTWSQWTGRCAAPCGEPGIRVKRRQCRFAINGENVIAVRNQAIAKCSTEQVPCTGECITTWLPWTSWSRCSETCGPGKSMRRRACYSQGRRIDEKLCFKDGVVDESVYLLTRDCNTEVCDSWTMWSGLQCSARCGSVGRRHKRRVCNGTGELRPLTSPLTDLSCFNVIERCTTPAGNLSYSNWLPWTRCSSACGRGVQRRFRTCTGDAGCRVRSLDCRELGPYREQRACNLAGCVRFAPWVDGPCSASCGEVGTLERTRRCLVNATPTVDTLQESCFTLTRPCRGSCT